MFVLRKDLWSGLCLLIFGVCFVFLSLQFTIWIEDSSRPGEGFFPFLGSALIVCLSLLLISKQLFFVRAAEKEKIDHEVEIKERSGGGAFRVFSYMILMLALGILIENVGFLVMSLGFLILTMKYIERQSWKITLWVGFASIAASYLLFEYLLGVSLPRGMIM